MAAASVEPTEYECPVCSEYFKHPKLLLCGHVLCRECLVSCLQSNAKATCPLCRCQMVDDENHDSKSAEEIADSLIDDVAMARVVESARILSGKNVCCVHSSVTASSLCLHCNDMLCKDCCHAHGIISATRHHVVESLTSLTAEKLAASRYVMCSAHNDRIAELFCSTHLVSLCHVCAVSDHRQCPEVANVKKETQAARSQLDQLLVTLGNADLSFKQKSDTLSQLELQMKNSTQSVVQTLEEAISYLQRSLEECHQRLREVRAADVVNLNAVKKLRDKLVKRHGMVVSHMIVVKRVQQTVSGSELLDVAAKLQTCVDRLHLDVSVPTNLNRVSMALHDFNPVVLTRLLQDGYWNHFRLVGAQSFIQGMEMSDGNDVNTNTTTDDKYSTLGATNNSETRGKEDNPDLNANLKFYKGRITSCPKGDYIDEIHRKWWGNYDKLEQHDGYIQWLFPIREQGMNWHAQELQPHEAKAIMADSEAMERFLNSYKMMLNFYGMELVSEKTGEVKRAKNCQERFRHLNHSMHNYLRITRILKCLGELGLEHYKAPFICFVLKEAIVRKTLDRTLDSCFKYWIGTLRNDEERADIDKYIDELYNDRFQEEENRKRKSGVENLMVEGVGEEESKGKNKQEENRKRQKENSMKKEEGKKSQEEENRREDEETRKRQEEENRNKENENERVDDETGKRKEEENRKREVKNESVLDDTRKKKEEENRKREEENERVNNETRMRQEEEHTKREEKNENVLLTLERRKKIGKEKRKMRVCPMTLERRWKKIGKEKRKMKKLE